MLDTGNAEEFIDDAEHHNQWWSDGASPELSQATKLTPRSDFHSVLKSTNTHYTDDVKSLVYAIHGQTGIGKTTLLHQLIAALLNTTEFPHQNQDLELTSAFSPRQILYLPLEDSLYQLERPGNDIKRLNQVIDYFQTHVAPRQGQKFILLDDVQALDLDENRKAELLDLIDDNTYVFLTGNVHAQVSFSNVGTADTVDEFEGPWPILPMKFIDTVQTGEGLGVEFNKEFRNRLEQFQSSDLDGPSPIKTIRTGLSGTNSETSLDTAVETLSELCFDIFDTDDRNNLHDAARAYLRTGGTLHQTDDASIRNDLAKSHFLLFLYKELAKYRSIQQPENLHRLSSIAATNAGDELQYTDLSDQIGVDRRTVDNYLDVLDEGIAVTESHDYSLRRYRRTRLYLRNPRHLVLLSQRQEHHGFEAYERQDTLNHEFEYKLARTVAFDHAKRLAFNVGAYDVEYTETESGLVDYILHRNGHVLPFVLSYHPYTDNAETIAEEFDPEAGQHTKSDSEELRDIDYKAPYRFIITDSLPKEVRENETLIIEKDAVSVCYLPYWLFLLIC
ncbi:AAA family ATPase [Halalkaliarchaeum desulfuricum]|uniref:AAA family ATPase n=1 Tax=Halalkaliarchaeum desulfuricum TaxID=2055893 RepID=A0A343TL87_9EURY|nr:AAA family ATPase [Halalkaliarchaeum desulfuricum]AUX09859.1 AAA family ATPase [Halalkaliarchaeum desulfuricum]